MSTSDNSTSNSSSYKIRVDGSTFEILTAGVDNQYQSVFISDNYTDDLNQWTNSFPKLFNVHFAAWYNKVAVPIDDDSNMNDTTTTDNQTALFTSGSPISDI